MRLLEWMKRDLRTIVVAVVAATVTAGAPALAHGVEHALFAHNADKVDGKHAVGASSSLSNAAGKLVTTTGTGRFAAKNMVLPLNMPPGFTARGIVYVVSDGDDGTGFIGQNITYPVRMSAELTPQILASGDSPTAECPGTWDNPSAAPGYLCIYEEYTTNVNLRDTEVNTRQGLGYYIYPQAAGPYWSVGGWAATPPAPTSSPAVAAHDASPGGVQAP